MNLYPTSRDVYSIPLRDESLARAEEKKKSQERDTRSECCLLAERLTNLRAQGKVRTSTVISLQWHWPILA